jgi:DNA-3-methyladenine glycosylase
MSQGVVSSISKQDSDDMTHRFGKNRLTQSFYEQETVALARALLGKKLVTRARGQVTSGIVVEVEAYLGSDDPACHAARGITARNAVMFKDAGHCYVYLIYGMYYCVNVVSERAGVGSAVLIRAVEPLEGVPIMEKRREFAGRKIHDLARGPGRLCDALGITTSLSGAQLTMSDRVWIEPCGDIASRAVGVSGRIGISQGAELPLRFFVKQSPWVSGQKTGRPAPHA